MVGTNPIIPQNLLIVIDMLAVLGQTISDQQEEQPADKDDPTREARPAAKQDNRQESSSNEYLYRKSGD